MTRITILLVTLLALVLVACGTEQTAATDPATTPSPTVEPTEAPTETPEPTDDGDGNGTGAPNELAAILPTEVGGISIEYEYTTGPDFGDDGEIDDEAQEFLDRVGGDIDRMTSAFGFGFDMESGSFISILAFRIPGADEREMLEGFRTSMADEDEAPEFSEETVGGKRVLTASTIEEGTTYLYVDNDTLFAIGATSAELAEDALSQLP